MSGVSRKTSISISGLDEFRKTLEELGGDFKKAIKKGARKSAIKIAKESNAEAKSRGWTEEKYYGVKERKSSRGSDTSVGIKVGTLEKKSGIAPTTNKIKWYKKEGDRFYVRFPEYGTIYQAPQPLLIPIFESHKESIRASIYDELNKAINKAKGKK